jgi:nucleotide-binding universal stress UspA family protein
VTSARDFVRGRETGGSLESPRHILCATDFSGNASKAFRMAVEVARSCGAMLRVVHVSPFDRTSRIAGFRAQARLGDRLERFVRSEEAGGLPVGQLVRQGEPGVEIVRASQDVGADLIVIGRHSQAASGEWNLGSVAEAVVRTSRCPVMVGEAGAPSGGTGVRRVLCALDLAETAAGTLAYAAGIARALRADLVLVHVAQTPEPASTELRALAASVPSAVEARILVVEGEVNQAIAEQVRVNESDLLVIGQHGGDLSPRQYLGGTTLWLLRRTECAVLVVPPHTEGETTAIGSVQA